MTSEEYIAKMKKAINQAIKVLGDRFGSSGDRCRQGHRRTKDIDAGRCHHNHATFLNAISSSGVGYELLSDGHVDHTISPLLCSLRYLPTIFWFVTGPKIPTHHLWLSSISNRKTTLRILTTGGRVWRIRAV